MLNQCLIIKQKKLILGGQFEPAKHGQFHRLFHLKKKENFFLFAICKKQPLPI